MRVGVGILEYGVFLHLSLCACVGVYFVFVSLCVLGRMLCVCLCEFCILVCMKMCACMCTP